MFGRDSSEAQRSYPNVHMTGTQYLRNSLQANLYKGDSFMEEKLTQMQLNWKFYNGRHWADNNDNLLAFNMCRSVVDKVNNFIAGKMGFELVIEDQYGEDVPEPLEKSYEALLGYNWRRNGKTLFAQRMLQMGSICGDVYIFVSISEDETYVEYDILDSRTVIPKFRDGDHKDVLSYRVVKQMASNEKKYILKVTEYTIGNVRTYYLKETGEDAEKFETENEKNDLPFIPMVHIQNIAMSTGYGGKSDIEDIIVLNKVYNEMAEDLKRIIDYYSEPTTVITGGTVGQLKKGLDQIWSGLPEGASVSNLTLGEDMGANIEFLKLVKNAIHDQTGVPEEVMSKVQHISNTSAAALQMLFQPLIQVADKKVVTYSAGMERLHSITMLMYHLYIPEHPLYMKLPEDFRTEEKVVIVQFERYRAKPLWKYNLPNDRLSMLNEAQLELKMKIGSRLEIMNRLGKKNNVLIMQQIEQDNEAEVKLAGELAKAQAPAMPGAPGNIPVA